MNLACMGTGSPTVVFENGAGGTILDWREVQVQVAKITRACTYDRAGLGYSDKSSSPRTAVNITDDLHDLVHSSRLRPIIIVGHSIGGLYATLYADRFMSDVYGLVLVDPSFAHQSEEMMTKNTYKSNAAQASQAGQLQHCADLARLHALSEGDASGCVNIKPGIPKKYHDYILHMGLRPEYWESSLSEMTAFDAPSGGSSVDTIQEDHARRAFGKLPLIVLTAGNRPNYPDAPADEIALANQAWKRGHDELAARSSIGKSIIVPDAGHFIQKDQPDEVVKAISQVVQDARESLRN